MCGFKLQIKMESIIINKRTEPIESQKQPGGKNKKGGVGGAGGAGGIRTSDLSAFEPQTCQSLNLGPVYRSGLWISDLLVFMARQLSSH